MGEPVTCLCDAPYIGGPYEVVGPNPVTNSGNIYRLTPQGGNICNLVVNSNFENVTFETMDIPPYH